MRDLINLHNGQITFLDSRFYLHPKTGEPYPSVTTILEAYPKSAQFYEWLKEVGKHSDEVRDNAGEEGGTVHRLCDEYDSGLPVSILDNRGRPQFKRIEWSMFERYVEFRTRFPEFKIVESEKHYYSDKHHVAGTLDRVFDLNGEKWLMDIKTSNSLYTHYWAQLAAYGQMYEENTGVHIDNYAIIYLKAKTRTDGKKGAIQGKGWQLAYPDKDISHYWRIFQATQMLWLEEHGDEIPRMDTYQITYQASDISATPTISPSQEQITTLTSEDMIAKGFYDAKQEKPDMKLLANNSDYREGYKSFKKA